MKVGIDRQNYVRPFQMAADANWNVSPNVYSRLKHSFGVSYLQLLFFSSIQNFIALLCV